MSIEAYPSGSQEETLSFDGFCLFPRRRILLKAGRPVRLGARAMSILIELTARAGQVVPERDLIGVVWPGSWIESGTLRVHMSSLRKALGRTNSGAAFIRNRPGEGYLFGGLVERSIAPTSGRFGVPRRAEFLPRPPTSLVGRDEIIDHLLQAVEKNQLVTVTGSAGIGKTRLAVAIGERTIQRNYLPYFIDFSTLSDPARALDTIASAMGLPVRQGRLVETIVALIGTTRVLLILDNCEHVLQSVRAIAEQARKSNSDVRLLATSREPLGLQWEYEWHLGPLEIPPSGAFTADEAVCFSSVRLFRDRVSSFPDFEFDGAVDAIVDICRRLDGIPLAIEMAAAHAGMFGTAEVERSLKEALEPLPFGRRTTVARHRTLSDALEWSYHLLQPYEQAFFRRIAIFGAGFDAQAALAVTRSDVMDIQSVEELLSGLERKSIISSGPKTAPHRLLQPIRAFALRKLRQTDEYCLVARYHAEFVHSRVSDSAGSRERSPDVRHGAPHIDDIRQALDWAFEEGGDARLGIELTARSAGIWFELSLLDEYKTRARRALDRLPVTEDTKLNRMRLCAALGHALLHTDGPVPSMAEAFSETLRLSDELGVEEHRTRAYWGICSQMIVSGDYQGALEKAKEFCRVAELSGDRYAKSVSKRMAALALHNLGKSGIASGLLEEILVAPERSERRQIDSPFALDDRVASRAFLAVTLWIVGRYEAAVEAASESIGEAVSIGHVPSLCYALAISACPLSLWSGDLAAAKRHVTLLLERSKESRLPFWNLWGRSYQVVIANRENVSLNAQPYLAISDKHPGPMLEAIATMCPEISDPSIYENASGQSGWCRAELLRVKGERMLRADAGRSGQEAERTILEALELSKSQGALAWETRACLSLARLWSGSGRRREALDLLRDVCARSELGNHNGDLLAARELVVSLG